MQAPRATSTPARVLLVEDSAGYARLVALLLEEAMGAAVSTRHAATLAAALDLLAGEGADVVLLDLSLPDAHGPEALDRLRASWPDLPVVVLSGRDEPGLAAELADRGVGFVRKGEEQAALGPAVAAALSRR